MPEPKRSGNVTDEIPECGSSAFACSLNEPDWFAFSQSFLLPLSYHWYWPPVTDAGGVTATVGALLSTRIVLIDEFVV